MYNIAPTYVASMSIQAKIELAQLLCGQSCLLDLEAFVAVTFPGVGQRGDAYRSARDTLTRAPCMH